MYCCHCFFLHFSGRSSGVVPDDVTEIKISGYNISLFSYTDEKKISEIVNYLNSLRLSDEILREDNYYHPVLPAETGGSAALPGGWRIELKTESGRSVAFISEEPAFGYVVVEPYPRNGYNPGNPVVTWWEISQSQFDKFVPLLKGLVPDKLPMYGGAYDEWLDGLDSSESLGLSLKIYGATSTGGSLYFDIGLRAAYPKGRLQTGEDYELEVMDENGNWKKMERISENGWGDSIFGLKNGGSTRLDVEWVDVYGELPEGQYRICKTVTDYVNDDEKTDYELYAEFTVRKF